MSAAVRSIPDAAAMAAGARHLHHNRDFALQKYLLLQEQHESLQQHLDQIRPPATASVTTVSSLSSSPTRRSVGSSAPSSSPGNEDRSSRNRQQPHRRSGGGAFVQQQQRPRHRSVPPFGLETVPDERTLHEVASEEAKLLGVNEGIKRALTELLNCEAVRADGALRTWVQGRLLETERELRTGRRRRSAPGAAEHY